MSNEDLGLDDERHMAHYWFAFVLLPVSVFGRRAQLSVSTNSGDHRRANLLLSSLDTE